MNKCIMYKCLLHSSSKAYIVSGVLNIWSKTARKNNSVADAEIKDKIVIELHAVLFWFSAGWMVNDDGRKFG